MYAMIVRPFSCTHVRGTGIEEGFDWMHVVMTALAQIWGKSHSLPKLLFCKKKCSACACFQPRVSNEHAHSDSSADRMPHQISVDLFKTTIESIGYYIAYLNCLPCSVEKVWFFQYPVQCYYHVTTYPKKTFGRGWVLVTSSCYIVSCVETSLHGEMILEQLWSFTYPLAPPIFLFCKGKMTWILPQNTWLWHHLTLMI